jgi:hypothetical protein
MARSTPSHADAARRLLALEPVVGEGATARAAAAERAYDEVSARLAPVIGVAGVEALVARSARIITADFPFMAEVRANHPPRSDLVECLRRVEPDEAASAAEALFATLFGLTGSLIGDRLLQRLLPLAFLPRGKKPSEENE